MKKTCNDPWTTLKKKNGRRRENWTEKIEVMAVGRNNECSQICIFIKENKHKQRDQFKYLASSDGRNNTEIAWRIAQAKIISIEWNMY